MPLQSSRLNGFTSPLLPTSTQITNIRNLTRSGSLPPDPLASRLRARIPRATIHLSRYNLEIDKLQKEMDRLVTERNTLRYYVNGSRSVLSAAHRLPTELLAYIFELCFPSEIYKIRTKIKYVDELKRLTHFHLIQLAKVSFRWYRTVMGTPSLWSNITVDTCPLHQNNVSASFILRFLATALKRGKNHPINLQLSISYEDYAEPIFELVSKHAHRWKNVRLFSYDAPERSNPLPKALGRLENLETLVLKVGWQMVERLDAPRLREFIYHGELRNLPKLPWAQLKHGEFRSSSHATSAHALALCADNSGTFVFQLSPTHHSHDTHAWNVSVSSEVRHLRLELYSPYDAVGAGKLLDCLTLPSLRSFTYVGELPGWYTSSCRPPKWSSESFVALSHRSGFDTHLVCLSVHAQVADNELLRCLQVLPQLETLIVEDPGPAHEATVTDVLLRGLLYAPDISEPLIPQLRVLTLKTIFNFGDAVYAEVVASRARQKFDNAPFHANLFSRIQSNLRMLSSAEAQGKLAELVSQGSLIFYHEFKS